MVLELFSGDLLFSAAFTSHWVFGADLIMSLNIRKVEGEFAVSAVEFALGALSLIMPVSVGQSDRRLARRTRCQQERALSFVVGLILLDGPSPGAAIVGADSGQTLHLPSRCIV